ncbi:MAG TPA: hypothetical protein VMR44_09010 [Thermoanaerobaculia bacterium]|nr:hypothetical protein [Thermoanaerobaculia bacterium]
MFPVVWGPLSERAPGALPVLLAAASAALLLAVRRLGRVVPGGPEGHAAASPSPSFLAILAVAALLRIFALPLAPTLSGDVHRYLWDGRVLLAGENPYRLAPADPALARLRLELGEARWLRIEHPEVPTVYPPLALGLFALAAATPAPLAAWKLLIAAADLAGCAALLALARRCGLPPARVAWYAWNPLVVVETAGMGHVDALGVAAAVAAVLLVVRSRGGAAGEWRAAAAAGVAAAAGALAKLVPLLALPMWARQSRRPLLLLVVAGALLAAAIVPVVTATGGVPPGLVAYGVSWEFDGPLYEPGWRLLGAAGADRWLAAGLDRVEEWTGRYELMDPVYPYVYPRLLAKVGLALLLAAAVARSALSPARLADPVAGTGKLVAAAVLAAATVYPWYLLWVLPWAALAGHRAWLLAAAAAPLAYLAAPAGPLAAEPFPWVWLAVWGPPAAAWLFVPSFRPWRTA